jgi:hypothetical protein
MIVVLPGVVTTSGVLSWLHPSMTIAVSAATTIETFVFFITMNPVVFAIAN